MMKKGARLSATLDAIDTVNARDPNTITVDGRRQPAELIYGRRMSATLADMAADASEALQIAARGQHIERWTTPRKSYPQGRAGYLKWRNDLKDFHARRLAGIMTDAGYGADEIGRVGALVRKERLKSDAETQLLEDVVCVVFLQYYLADFMRKTEEEKLSGILVKTWRKMSAFGHKHALRLELPAEVQRILRYELDKSGPTA